MTLGDRIAQSRREKAARERRDISLSEVAEASGTTIANYSRWESNQRVPREDALAKLAKFLGVTPAYLRYGVVDSVPKPAEPPVVPFTPIPYTPPDAFEVLREQREAAEREDAAKPARKKNGTKGRGGGRG